jgi:GNAT superfamily N-acetyltransferase
MYLTHIDLDAVADQPLEPMDGVEVRWVPPDDTLIGSFPHLTPAIISRWAGPGHFFFLARHCGRPVSYRCIATTAGPSLAAFFRLRPHHLFVADIFTCPDFRRRGVTRIVKLASARHLARRGYREMWAVETTTNYNTIVANDRTHVQRVGTLIRRCVLGRTKFSMIPGAPLSIGLVRGHLQLLQLCAPGVSRVGLLFNPAVAWADAASIESIRAAAADLGVVLTPVEVRDALDQVSALQRAFATMAELAIDGLIVHSEPMLRDYRHAIVSMVQRLRIPAVYDAREFVVAGGLLSYGYARPCLHDFESVMAYVDSLKATGHAPIDATKPDLVLNAKAVTALGLAVPSTLLATATG